MLKLERNTNSSTMTLKGKLERTEHRLKLECVRSSNEVMRMLDKMASDHKAGESCEALATDLKFSFA